jgi:exodeoxyribonuclease V alpha subunit
MTYFSGRVHTVVYENPSQAFYILKLVLDPEEETRPSSLFHGSPDAKFVTVKGSIPGLSVNVGTWFGFEAEWQEHKEWGPQLSIRKAPVFKGGWSPDTAIKVLVANGVSEMLCLHLRAHFKDDFLQAMSSVERLLEVPGVDKFAAQHLVQRWNSAQAYFRTLGFLNDLGLPPGVIRQVWQTFKDDAETVLSENPWALVQIEGITFPQVDEVATRLGLDPLAPNRVRGAVLYCCKNNRSFGHLYLTTDQVVSGVSGLLSESNSQTVASSLAGLHKDGLLVIDKEARPGTLAVYEPWFHSIEKDSAALLRARQHTASSLTQEADWYLKRLSVMGAGSRAAAETGDLLATAVAAVEDWSSGERLKLSDAQKGGVVNALLEPVSILTGLPGTGKTTSLKAVVRILKDCEIPFLLCAPTGIAAKNLGARTHARSSTIHRAFSAKLHKEDSREAGYTGIVGELDTKSGTGEEEVWGFHEGNPYPADVVIVDEASMIDQHLLYRVMSCTSSRCRVVFVGDAAQLPSVGPGNVLRDLITSKQFPTTSLVEIYRQKDKETDGAREISGIVKAAHSIIRGEVPDDLNDDFRLVEIDSEDDGLKVILRLAEKLYEKRENFQILSPRHAGTLGVTNLNSRLRELLNPKSPGLQEIKLDQDTIREDDRIMVIRNDYKKDIFNGDVGKIVRVDRKSKEVEIKIFGETPLVVRIPFAKFSKTIRLAYACTVHKAQGLEYDHIIMPLVDSFRHQLQRNLLYTGVTRAKKRVFLIGTRSALSKAVRNDREDLRNTLFVDRLLAD